MASHAFDPSEVLAIQTRLEDVRQRIASKGSPRDVRLVAVSKFKPVAAILAAYEKGQRDFGENYIQELVDKAAVLPKDIRWHFIGHLQSNKVKKLLQVAHLTVLETLDSLKLACLISKEISLDRAPLSVFLQVNTSGEEKKSGCEPSEAPALAKSIRDSPDCSRVKVCGLMTIGKLGGDARADFEALRRCGTETARALGIEESKLELSMGMSADFEIAIEYGSTNVRIGSTIFGERAETHDHGPEAQDKH